MKYDIAVIGAGPAGLMAAQAAGVSGKRVCVLERNREAGRKICATGNGRCNILNEKAPHAPELKKALEDLGILCAAEEDGRLYPRCREASFAARALVRADSHRADMLCGLRVTSVQKTEPGFVIESVRDENGSPCETICADRLIIACGGKAAIHMGCTGDGYRWASAWGHTVIRPIPALVGLCVQDDISSLAGTRLSCRVSMVCDGEEKGSRSGEVQFGKDYISGICVMDLSRFYRLSGGSRFSLHADCFPEYTKEQLQSLLERRLRDLGDPGSRGAVTAGGEPSRSEKYISPLEGLVPAKLCAYAEGRASAEGVSLWELMKDLSFTVCGTRGWKEAQVTSGGVSLSEICGDTFESRMVPGLYFAGEILDYDGPCGGYNLSNAWRTAVKCAGALCD